MKRKTLVIVSIVMAACFVAIGAEEKPWYDMKNCEFCKPWSIPEMTKNCVYDQVETANGVLMLVQFPESFRPKYQAASAEMDALSKKAATGAPVKMCGSCEAMGSLIMKGMKMEELPTKFGVAMLLTSNDTALVADIHKWARRNAEEEQKMKQLEKK